MSIKNEKVLHMTEQVNVTNESPKPKIFITFTKFSGANGSSLNRRNEKLIIFLHFFC